MKEDFLEEEVGCKDAVQHSPTWFTQAVEPWQRLQLHQTTVSRYRYTGVLTAQRDSTALGSDAGGQGAWGRGGQQLSARPHLATVPCPPLGGAVVVSWSRRVDGGG